MKDKGFSLISILIVVGILAVVAGGDYYYTNLDNTDVVDENNVEDILDEAENVKDSLNEHNNDINEVLDETSDWKIYTNEKYGFSLKYPNDGDLDVRDDYIGISGPSEESRVVSIRLKNITLNEFIQDYNKPEYGEKIHKQEDYTIGEFKATKLTASTAIGFDINFIFIEKEDISIVIVYQEYDELHNQIISTLEIH